MAEGIMGLAPGMGAPAAPQQAPQELDPRNLQVFMDATASMDPDEFEGQMDEAIGGVDPALAQQMQAGLSAIKLPPEILQSLLDIVYALLEAPEKYAEYRMELIEIGLPEDFLPEEFNLEYLSTFRYVLARLKPEEAALPVQGFRNGGPVSLKPIARFLQSQGRNGDTLLAHINKTEAAMLRRMGGAGTINPVTGLREYGWWEKTKEKVSKAFKSVGKAISAIVRPVINFTKKLLSNPIVRTIATVAAVYFSGGTASALLGAGAAKTAAGIALGATINSTAVNLLAGDKPGDALKSGLMVGVTSGAGAYFGGMPLTQGTSDVVLTNPFTGSQSTVRGLGKGALDAVNPFSSSTPTVTADTEFAKLTGKGLPKTADTYRLATEAAKTANASTILGMSPSTLLTTAATLGPPILAQLGKEPPPKPEDLNIPGVGGPSGSDLLDQDPDKYGIDLGGTSSTYVDPYAGLANTPAMNIGGGSGEPAPVSAPGAPAPLPGAPSIPFDTVSPTMPEPGAYNELFSGYDPTKDPMNPLYNPFAASTQAPAAPGSLTGGFDTTEGFAKGGIATIPVQRFAQGGGARANVRSTGSYGRSYMVPQSSNSPPTAPKLTADQKLQNQAKAFKTSQAAKDTVDRRRATEASAGSNAQYERMARERIAAAAKVKAEEQKQAELQVKTNQAVEAAARAASLGQIYRPEDRNANIYGNAQEQEDAIARARVQNPERFLTPVERDTLRLQEDYKRMLREEENFKRVQADKIKVAEAEARARAENERVQKQIDDFKKYQDSILNPPSTVTNPTAPTTPTTPGAGGIGTLPITDPSIPTAPNIPVTNPGDLIIGGSGSPSTEVIGGNQPGIGIDYNTPDLGAPIFTQQVVYGPDGKSYPNPSAAISAGVFNYSNTPPMNTLPMPPSTTPAIPSFTPDENMFAPPPNVPVTPTNVPDMFAKGGIATMAPYKFSRGSSPIQQYPRRTGPINGPGTGTSDSIPAMLSDGEFVFTAKAVRNMGGGSRLDGAKKMYRMMKTLEGKS